MTTSAIAFEVIPAPKYQAALQHPAKVFGDPRLQRSKVEMRGDIPRFRTGGFAVVYRLTNRDNNQHREEALALRCFKRLAPDLADRYAKISDHLDLVAARSRFLVRSRYLREGIRIDGGWKPVTTMNWLDGDFLDVFLDTAASRPYLMAWLESRIRALAYEMKRNGMAHGDLHHKNMLISTSTSGEPALRLIDYDGMFVPALARKQANELGQEDYQHPERNELMFDDRLDDFSLHVLYLNVIAIQRHPELWDARTRTEGLLTRADDYRDPDGSAILARLGDYADLREMVRAFKRICAGPFEDIPSPRTFFDLAVSRDVVNVAAAQPSAAVRSSRPAVTAPLIGANRRALRAFAGESVVVVSRYSRFSKGDGTPGSPYRTLHLEATGGATLELMVERSVATHFKETGRAWTVKRGDWLQVAGLLLNDGDRFVIDLEQPANLTRLDAAAAMRELRKPTGFQGGDGGAAPDSATPGDGTDLRTLLGIKENHQ